MKKIFLMIVFASFTFHSLLAVTWKTILPGFWNSPSVWQGGTPPPIVCGDTILIQHPIVITSTITLTTGAHLIIDNYGGICGHQELIVHANATVIKYGIIELDVLNVPGGYVVFNMPGNWKLTNYGLISNGGYFHVNGAGGAVGPWFNCQMPEYGFLTGLVENETTNGLNVFPNPSSGTINFSNVHESHEIELQIVNAEGKLIYENKLSGNSIIKLEGLASGIYFYYTQNGNSLKNVRNKFIVID